ncbi:hypothetical protein FHS55_003425 [Angulomicrobium tetraedrale]|uniref:Metallo-beta-lactamase domain-containing protein n=1 Tax=Ancylobacter tetraedralis TaxID=217068 RepID=A0A839ZDI5_9HYPH|nr:hypothetical protein [Ancylobacter tetraedralis]MBB3772804.1 hypothetical protein [Ancylobacter tetraedralis]
MLRLELLPACEGDCLVLSWGDAAAPRRMLIDGGRSVTAGAVKAYAAEHRLGEGAFELFVITHIDRDHIEGAVDLLGEACFRRLVKEVWFNDRADLDYHPAPGFEEYGALDGERITRLIRDHGISTNLPFAPKPVAMTGDDLTVVELAGGLTLTLLSPDLKQLKALADPWDETMAAAPLGWEDFGDDQPIDVAWMAARPFRSDSAKPNGSSIAFVASYGDVHILLTGDAHVGRLQRSLELFRVANPEARFSLVKTSHHGSRGNTSAELVRLLDCSRWAVSTNGTQFRHPDLEAVARIAAGSPAPVQLFFNYDTGQTSIWRGPFKQPVAIDAFYGIDGYIAIDVA